MDASKMRSRLLALALALAAAGLGVGVYLFGRTRRSERREGALPAPAPGTAFSEGNAVVRGVAMRWLEHGHGTPVVFLHGIPTSPMLWRRVMPLLRHAHAFAWEMVGYGGSIREGAGRDISLGRQAEYLVDWLRHMRLGRVVLAGHDLGGGVAQIVAARYPELCSGLFLVNSVAYDSWPIASVKAVRSAGALVRRLPASSVTGLLAGLLRRGHDDQTVSRESARLHLKHYLAHGAGAALVRQVRSLDAHDTLAIQTSLPHLKVPARVVWGQRDPFQKRRYGRRLASDLGTVSQLIEGGRHFTPEDRPEEVATALNDLLREVESEAERAHGITG
jgi:pimeloyl-ACP methyl ester carboxylesterase